MFVLRHATEPSAFANRHATDMPGPWTCLAQRSVKPLPPTLTLALGLFALDAAGALVGAKLPLRAVVMAHTKLLREYSILRLAARAAPPGRAVGVLEARLPRRSAGRRIDGSICI